MSPTEAPSCRSSRVQRASRINGIEASRLQQKLQYIEQAKIHQRRLTNQDIRIISLSIDYIQTSSGHSPEAFCSEVTENSTIKYDREEPCFLYGERLWSKKKRRAHRPMSAAERSCPSGKVQPVTMETLSSHSLSSIKDKRRPASSAGALESYSDLNNTLELLHISDTTANCGRVLSSTLMPGKPLTPRQAWEDNTSDITKKILKAQKSSDKNKAYHLNKHQFLHQLPGDEINAQSFKNVRSLMRKIRVSTTSPWTNADGFHCYSVSPADKNQHPRRPSDNTVRLGPRASLGDILYQGRPTISAAAWRSHLSQISRAPMPIALCRQLAMSARKERNVAKTAQLYERVRDFVMHS